MSRIWMALVFLNFLAPSNAAMDELGHCRNELRSQIFDRYLLSACERLISAIEKGEDDDSRYVITLLVASNGVRSNVARCQRTYGKSWEAHWRNFRPSLVTAYGFALQKVSMMAELPDGENALRQLDDDVSWMGLNQVLTASTAK